MRSGPPSALVIDHLEEALGPVRGIARSARPEARAPRARPAAARSARAAAAGITSLRRAASIREPRRLRGPAGSRCSRAEARRRRRQRCALEAARADRRGEPDAAGQTHQHAADQRRERGAPAQREPAAALLVAAPAARHRTADPDVPVSPVHAATSSSVAPPRSGGESGSASSARVLGDSGAPARPRFTGRRRPGPPESARAGASRCLA